MQDEFMTSETTRHLRQRSQKSQAALHRVGVLKVLGQFILALGYVGIACIGYGILNKVIAIDERQQKNLPLRQKKDSQEMRILRRIDSLLSSQHDHPRILDSSILRGRNAIR